MNTWRFSWRAIGAAFGAAVATGALFGLALSLLDLWASPEERGSFLSEFAVLALAAAIALAIGGGLLLLIASVASRVMPWPRPWVEAAIAGAILFALTATGDLLSFTFSTSQGTLPPDHLISVLGAHVAPAVSGALFPILYWLMARPDRV